MLGTPTTLVASAGGDEPPANPNSYPDKGSADLVDQSGLRPLLGPAQGRVRVTRQRPSQLSLSTVGSARGGGPSQAELGRGTGIDRSDVTTALTELESRRLVERTVDADHKRRNIVTLTSEGVDQLRELDAVIDNVQEQVLAPLTPTQRRQFIGLISRMLASG